MCAICLWKIVHACGEWLNKEESPCFQLYLHFFCTRSWLVAWVSCLCSGNPLSPTLELEKKCSIFTFLQVKFWGGHFFFFKSLQERLHLCDQTLCEYVTGFCDKNVHVTLEAVLWQCHLYYYFIVYLCECSIFWISFPNVSWIMHVIHNIAMQYYSSIFFA